MWKYARKIDFVYFLISLIHQCSGSAKHKEHVQLYSSNYNVLQKHNYYSETSNFVYMKLNVTYNNIAM